MKLKGIDISQYQGTIDFDTLKKEIDFVMIRAGFGLQLDSMFKRNISECNRVGIPCGIYWFSYALTEAEARAEARLALSVVKDFVLEYPIAYDFEDDSVRWLRQNGVNVTPAIAQGIVKAFLDEIKEGGYYGVNYTNLNFINLYGFDKIKADMWLALWTKYYSGNEPPRPCTMWQFTDSGKVGGISTNVDSDFCYVDYPTLIMKKGMNRLVEPAWKEQASSWAVEAVDWAVTNGILQGKGGDNYDLQGSLTREQMCVMLRRYYDKFGGK